MHGHQKCKRRSSAARICRSFIHARRPENMSCCIETCVTAPAPQYVDPGKASYDLCSIEMMIFRDSSGWLGFLLIYLSCIVVCMHAFSGLSCLTCPMRCGLRFHGVVSIWSMPSVCHACCARSTPRWTWWWSLLNSASTCGDWPTMEA